MSPVLSIIIVQYKIPELLQRCIDSLYQHRGDLDIEVIVVNNDIEDVSHDPIVASHPEVKWIDAGYNAGFSRANNLGIARATGEYILILNPDTEVREEFLSQFVANYRRLDMDGSLGLLGCRIISSVDGSLLVGSGQGFPSLGRILRANPLYIYLTRRYLSAERSYIARTMHYTDHEIDVVSGACVMVRREKIVKDGLLFDEDFFLYSEDVEWSYRFRKAGYRNFFCSDIEVYHVNSASTGFSPAKSAQMQISAYLFYLKSHSSITYLLFGLVTWLNFKMNISLLDRAGRESSVREEQIQLDVFSRHFLYILKVYNSSKQGERPYLRYDPQNQK
ncbi:MAG: glycosyltransferase family 2 protein [Bacteroidetes bacterium]|nr:glycosyltransferase family 2 protein [Bacteroidota bacterium]